METVGKFEFSRKDLIGHGAFAVVFKGRHKEELKHENIVALHDFQYCNGGDLADCLHSKGTLSEDTIRVFLHQIAGAMRVLQAKGVIHRDLKPQNILLSHGGGRKSSPSNTCIKIADFGFARYLQSNMMAATLCGSPMYMAPEVIMSQNYDAKADLWSIGTIVFQCLTGKAPFQASSPQDLRLFYEKNKNLNPNIPRETSSHLRHLLQGLLQRNPKDRMDFVAEIQQLRPKPPPSQSHDSPDILLKDSVGGSGGAGSSKDSSCDTDDFVIVPAQFPGELTSEVHDGKIVQDSLIYCGSSLLVSGSLGSQVKTPPPSPPFSSSGGGVVPPVRRCNSGGSLCFGRMGASPPYPAGQGATLSSHRLSVGGPRTLPPSPQAQKVRDGHVSPQKQGLGSRLHSAPCLLEAHSSCRQRIRKQHSDPLGQAPLAGMQARPLHSSPRLTELMHRSPLPTILGSSNLVTLLTQQGLVLAPNYDRVASDHNDPVLPPGVQPGPCFGRSGDESKGSFGRSLSAGRLSDLLLKAAFGPPVVKTDSSDSLVSDRPMDTTVPPGGGCEGGMAACSDSPARVVFTVGSPPQGSTPPQTGRTRMFSVGSSSSLSSAGSFSSRQTLTGMCTDCYEGPSSPQFGLTDPTAASLEGAQEQTETLRSLRFSLAFAQCVAEIASYKGHRYETGCAPTASSLRQPHSLIADQISLLSRDWSYAEQLVLYMKLAELLSSALHTAMGRVKQGKLYPSSTVKQVVRRLNDLYKSSVQSCRCLSAQLQPFFQHKQQLMDRINSITAERLIFGHAIQMVQSAALDEMFHHGGTSVQQYRRALLLMDGLSLLITDQADILSITKCKQCIERRLSALQSGPWP
ncbi:hypothetical protein JZ751_012056 [Albula glossodonta]|uniref:non-specific serine/threonine protein kinase n=1 Tax=Albula glossodonta TaxID=121402 RepID=A0A8T2PRA9_9TELE|nr:hypothetical protein JZ751_012056 [Albula glossodonta]